MNAKVAAASRAYIRGSFFIDVDAAVAHNEHFDVVATAGAAVAAALNAVFI